MQRLVLVLLVLGLSACDDGGMGDPTSEAAQSERLGLLAVCWHSTLLPDECQDLRCVSDADCEAWEFCGDAMFSRSGERFCGLRRCAGWPFEPDRPKFCDPPRGERCTAESCPFDPDSPRNRCDVDAECYLR